MNWKKGIFVGLLCAVIFTASFFMVTESARYYTFFYEKGAWQPIYLAGLLELFLLLLAAVKITDRRPLFWIQKSIMVGIFFVIIFAAGMQAIKPTLDSIVQIQKESAYTELLKREYENLERDRDVFVEQNQKRNTAITAKERRRILDDLRDVWESDLVSNKGAVALTNILLLFVIRFLVQLANVFSATILGKYYRTKGERNEISEKDRVLSRFPDSRCFKAGEIFVVRSNYRDIGKGKSALAAWKDAAERLN